MPPKVRPAGSGRKVRAKRRREELAAGGRLLSAVAYHGHTASGRLRLLNTFLQIFWAKELFSSQITGVLEAPDEEWKDVNPLVVDVGFGEEPTTTRELRGLLREGVNVVATEADEARLEAARASQTDASGIRRDIRFCYTGTTFDLPQSQAGERLVLVLAMNVLRDYHVWDAGLALARMWSQLPDGASMVEGSCDIHGSRLAAVLLRGGEQRIAGFLFAADVLAGSRGPSNAPLEGPPPSWFERYIPRLWLKGKNGGLDGLSNAEPGGERPANAVHAFLRAWSAAANETAGINGDGGGVWQWFRSSTRVLREMDDRVDTTMAEHGLLVWWAQEELPMYHPKAPAPQEESLSKDYRERQP